MASRTIVLWLGFLLVAFGPQARGNAAANESAQALAAQPIAADSSPSASGQTQHETIDRTNKTGAGVVGDILLKVGTLDGARVIGFELRDRCRTVLTTAKGNTTIDWSKVEDWAARLEGGQRVIPIDDGNGVHAFGVPAGSRPGEAGDAGVLVESGLSGLADNCHP